MIWHKTLENENLTFSCCKSFNTATKMVSLNDMHAAELVNSTAFIVQLFIALQVHL